MHVHVYTASICRAHVFDWELICSSIHVCLGCVHVHVHTQCTYMYIVCLACTFLSWHEYFQCQGNKSPYLDMPRLVHTLLPLPEKQTNTCTWVQATCMWTCTWVQYNVAYNICIGIDLWSCVHYIQFLSMFICLNRKQETRELTESYIHHNTYMYVYMYISCVHVYMYTCVHCTYMLLYTCTCMCSCMHIRADM